MSRIGTRAIALLIAGLAAALPARAQESAPEADSEGRGQSRLEPTLHGQLRLSLSDAVAMSVENNLDVEVARFTPLISLEDHEIAWGAYDPTFDAEYGYQWIETPRASSLFTGAASPGVITNRGPDGTAGIQGLVPRLGASYGLRFTGAKQRNDAFFQTLDPEYTSSLRAELSVPLMRNLLWNEPWTQVKTTKILYEGQREDFRRELMDTVKRAEDAYWGLVAAEERLRVAQKSLDTSRALLHQTRIQYEVGVVSRVEVTEAEAGQGERELNLIREENGYRRAQDVLIDLALGPHLTAASRLEIEPTDDPKDVILYDVGLEEAARKAYENRPELSAARTEVERQRILLKFAQNQRLPRLDATGSYGIAGLSGDAPGSNQSFRDSFDDYFSGEQARQWSVRGLFSFPLGNRSARHSVSKTQLELRRARTRMRRLEQSIVLEVRDAARNLESAQEGIGAAERRRIASAEQLRAERIRLEHGESTPFRVLEREEDFVEAESQKIAALQLYHVSVAGLERAQGTTLKARNIRVDEAARLR